MKVNQRTIDLIKEFEGFRVEAYRDIAGIWTIGYGTTAAAGVGITPRPGMKITQAEAEWYLQKAVYAFSEKIKALLRVEANENEFGAFVSLAYNIGVGAFSRSSALRHFNAGRKTEAANAMLAWNKATVDGKKQVVRGLQRRREAEKALFLSPVDAKPQTPPTAKKPGSGAKFGGIGWVVGLIGAAAAYFWSQFGG